ncbi:MAG: IS110 family transposase [Bacilli bacterium]|nr:IS110 family transposase [Bacilli bacterium]
MKAVLSVDVAKGKSMVMLSTEYGEILIEPKEIKHNLKDFDELRNQIDNFKLEDLTILMESTGIYHLQ